MDKAITFLKGKKTYIQAAGAAVTIGLFASGLIEKGLAETILGLLGVGMVASLGAKIDRAKSA